MRHGLVCSLLVVAGCAAEIDPVGTGEVEGVQAELRLRRPYLALGDSIAFGFNPIDAAESPREIDRFRGYPELISRVQIPAANAACPGESSGSFLDVGAADNGCHRGWRARGNALHVDYSDQGQSQLDYALDYLERHPTTATVSLGIGANDLLMLRAGCAAEHPAAPADAWACIGELLPATLKDVASNVATTLGAIRESGYRGELVVVTYYSASYGDPENPDLQAVVALDQALVSVAQIPAFGARVARGFSAFALAASLTDGDACAAGLLYALPDGTCDQHPSRLGQSLLAGAVATAVPATSIDLTSEIRRY